MKADPMSIHNFAKKIASRYIGNGIEFEDLLSIAMIGAVEACIRFDPDKGALTTIAAFWMRNELNRAVYRRYTPVVVNGVDCYRRFIEDLVEQDKLDRLSVNNESPEKIFTDQEFDKLLKKRVKTLSKRDETAFNDHYYIGNYDKYMSTYNSTKQQAIKAASNAKIKIIRKMKQSLVKEDFV